MDLGRILVGSLTVVSAAYQVAAIVACVLFRRSARAFSGALPPISVIKPLKGADASLRAAIESHLSLTGEFELLCGFRVEDKAAASVVAEYPQVRAVICATSTVNAKVGSLVDLASAARYDLLIQNDADICVPRGYLEDVAGPVVEDPNVGFVTCLYRPVGSTLAAKFEGLGTVTDFAPSALVGRMIGVDELAVGATMAFRRSDLERIGGFQPFGDYLADDFQLGARLRALGKRGVISQAVVETELTGTWHDVWQHQLRWTRTLRVSNGPGYLGLIVTFTTLWALFAALGGLYWVAAIALLCRVAMAWTSGIWVMKSRDAAKYFWLIPVRDLYAGVVWACGIGGRTVVWRGVRHRLRGDGRLG